MNTLDLLIILRLQIGCLCVTFFMAIPFFAIRRAISPTHKVFRYILVLQIISLSFDMITVFTVNHLDSVPAFINKLCHIIFISSLCFFVYLVFLYVRHLITENTCKMRLFAYGIPALLSISAVVFSPLYYAETEWGNYSRGPGATAVYCVVAVYLIAIIYALLRYRKKIDADKQRVILIALLTEIFFSAFQLFVPTVLMSGLGTTLITLAVYLTLENPDRILRDLYHEEKLDLLDKVHYDALTGIYNRRFMEEGLNRVIKSTSRYGGLLSILMLDVDFFKRYNDLYGHSKGDECLKMVANVIKNSITRTDDFAARYGGEEFIVVLPNTDKKGAHIMADKILNSIRACNIPHNENEAAGCVTISIGITTGKVEYMRTVDDCIKRADEALYMSKQNGRNKYTFLPND